MSELARSGLTVLFVSHNLDLIPRLCRVAVTLEAGRLREIGPAKDVAGRYLRGLETRPRTAISKNAFRAR